ncbi:hypothetical protein BJ508DRAFT_365435 [Ascobolus immersus RN42]|uniref:C2H2-type domain-containing protein n=1 Tax=Ascobolus immersus RN42 TaxID=1160509 RepID=A0A3N4HV97_ASCIM|nr:hypothetical protein BJ508DRAFT_365435 [Ascobolus immersus RN42]
MFLCEARQCGAAFIDEDSLERHHRTGLHHAELYCYPCDQHFRSFGSLQNHLAGSDKHITNKDTAECEHCEHLYLKDFTLNKHQDSCEANWYVCQVDGCPFKDKSEAVDLHIARVHDGARVKERSTRRKTKEPGAVSHPAEKPESHPKRMAPAQLRSVTVQTDDEVPSSANSLIDGLLKLGGIGQKLQKEPYRQGEPERLLQARHLDQTPQKHSAPKPTAERIPALMDIDAGQSSPRINVERTTTPPAGNLRFESKEQKPKIHSPIAAKPPSTYDKIFNTDTSKDKNASVCSTHSTEFTGTTKVEGMAESVTETLPRHTFGVHTYDDSIPMIEDFPTPNPDDNSLRIEKAIEVMKSFSREEADNIMHMARSGEKSAIQARKIVASAAAQNEKTSDTGIAIGTAPSRPGEPSRQASSKLGEVLSRIQEKNYSKKVAQAISPAPSSLDSPRPTLSSNEAHRILGERVQNELRKIEREKELAKKRHHEQNAHNWPQQTAIGSSTSPQVIKDPDETEDRIARKIASLSQHNPASRHQTAVEASSPADWFTPRSDFCAEQKPAQKPKHQAKIRVPTPLCKGPREFRRLTEINCPHCREKFDDAEDFEEHYTSKHAFGEGDSPLCRGCNRTFKEQKGLKYHLQDCDLGKEAHLIFEQDEKPKFATAEAGSAYLRAFEFAEAQKSIQKKQAGVTKQYTSDKFRVFENLDACPAPTIPVETSEPQIRKNSLGGENYGRLTPPDNLLPLRTVRHGVGIKPEDQMLPESPVTKATKKSSKKGNMGTPSSTMMNRNVEDNWPAFTSPTELEPKKASINPAQAKFNEMAQHKQTFTFEEVEALLAVSVRESSANEIGLTGLPSPKGLQAKPIKIETLEDSRWANAPSDYRTDKRGAHSAQGQQKDNRSAFSAGNPQNRSIFGGPIGNVSGVYADSDNSRNANSNGQLLFGKEAVYDETGFVNANHNIRGW